MAVKNKSTKKNVSNSEKLQVETIIHDEATRKNIPTAEYQSIMQKNDQNPIIVAYERRNRDMDPQLVWRGKEQQNLSDLLVSAPPLYIQEKVHPKVLIDDLVKQSSKKGNEDDLRLFADFNGLPNEGAKTEFYQHDSHWSNRMILGDSLQVMASLSEREGLRGKVQCIFFDPPYGIKFNSNFQWSTTDKAGTTSDSTDKISREPEQVKAFRDTWKDGTHSYLSYIRDRLTVAHDLLTSTGSIFVQISDENVHRVRSVMDEVFGEDNFIALIPFRKKTMPFGSKFIEQMSDFIIWYGKEKESSSGKANSKYRKLYLSRSVEGEFHHCWYENVNGERVRMTKDQLFNHSLLPTGSRVYRLKSLEPSGKMLSGMFKYNFRGNLFDHPKNGYGTTKEGLDRIKKSNRLEPEGNRLCYVLFADEGEVSQMTVPWSDTVGADNKQYVVQTNTEVVKRCILMTTDPGDLVLDPTCGSGTTAYVSEQWGRRWITIDTSRVALALARARIMGARYPYYLLNDSIDGLKKLAELSKGEMKQSTCSNNIRLGFVYEKIPKITLSSIAQNREIDVIWEKWNKILEPLLLKINKSLRKKLEEWEVPLEIDDQWDLETKKLIAEWWKSKASRQKEIDTSIAENAGYDYLYDKPYVNNKKVRVAGPFTVESVSPHKILNVKSDDNFEVMNEGTLNFNNVIMENLKNSGVQQAHKEGKINFTSLNPWPGQLISAEGFFIEHSSGKEKRAAIFIGPEFGTVSRPDLVEAAKEAADADFDVLIACAFNYDAMASDFQTLGRIPILKARMNADLHMADDLKNTGKGNLFVVFGEPDIEIKHIKESKIQVKINGVDIFHPNTGEVKSDGADGIACWFIDTDYNEESFFVRHAYFLGANDPYKALKTSLKAEIDKEVWDSLNSDTSRPFDKPKSGRIAIKVINHLGDEVMKVFKVN